MNTKIVGAFHIPKISEQFNFEKDLNILLGLILRTVDNNQQSYKKTIVQDFFTDLGNDSQLIQNRLQIITKNLKHFASEFGAATASLEIAYVPVLDEEGIKFSERKAFNLIIER